MNQPLVSVVIPTFNSAAYLPATLDSVLNQTCPDLEILVVDDGSTDGTAEILASYGDKIRCLHQENWGGPSRPRNVAVQAATGEYISFFDSDDLMRPEKIAAALEVFEQHPEVDFTFSNFQVIEEGGKVVEEDFLARYSTFRNSFSLTQEPLIGICPGRAAFSQLLKANFVGTSSVVCKRSVFDEVGQFDEEMLNADDVDMWRRIAFSGFRFAYIDRVLHHYRKRPGGVTGRGARRYPAILRGLNKLLDLELEPEEKRILRDRIHGLELGYAYALRHEGDFRLARKVYEDSLSRRWSWGGVRGYLKAVMTGLLARREK